MAQGEFQKTSPRKKENMDMARLGKIARLPSPTGSDVGRILHRFQPQYRVHNANELHACPAEFVPVHALRPIPPIIPMPPILSFLGCPALPG